MKHIFSNYVIMFRPLTEYFENKSLIKTQTHARRLKKLGWEGGLKIFSHMTWNNWSRKLMREKSFQLNSRNDCKIWSKVSIHTLNRHILIKDWIRNFIDTIRTRMFFIRFTYNHIIIIMWLILFWDMIKNWIKIQRQPRNEDLW